MDKQVIFDFASANPVCYLATCDSDQPRVRGMLMWKADEKGFWFHTGSTKNMYAQMKNNPLVEVCFFNNDPDPGTSKMMRVSGKAEFVDDDALKEQLREERPFLKAVPGGVELIVFRITSGEAWFWTMQDNLRENEMERVKF